MNKLVLVLNCGSSSLKFAVLDSVSGDEKLSGLAECFNLDNARIKWKLDGNKGTADLGAGASHKEAVAYIVNNILKDQKEMSDAIVAIGHRVVHGGEKFTSSVIIDDSVMQGIEDCATLAPLHNPAHLIGIRAAQAAFPTLPQVAVFDTAFHQTMPEKAYLYALPYKLYRENGIRRYGMHGTSHLFIGREAAALLGQKVEETNIINCHLGNGASICAIKDGKSVDTSMGMTPLEGLVMGTRSGDLDPSIINHLVTQCNYTLAEVNSMLNNESGLLGVSEISSDCRAIEDGYAEKQAGAVRAMELSCYRLAKYIASYAAALGRIDAIVFTGGIGENSDVIRALVLNQLSIFGIEVDDAANTAARFGSEGTITTANSKIKAMVISTNEELVIAQDAVSLIS
ncbi:MULTISPECIES: acetate kinase [unclassified Moritella]|uniref:acetate kinase n=1 Tax=unclassified Moritella TaxID=2637987 RepID=UPI001BAC5574|nr:MULTISPECIES: acetate kinase [unclassified Moritella]QUM81655.1 acetate kinase [Moritella sp. 5]QUM85967.1 acetate kinase [Moritella sp. 28]